VVFSRSSFVLQVLQKDIESRSRNINAVLKLSERLQDELEEDSSLLQFSQAAQQIQRRWHGVWLQSLESQCRLENALKAKKVGLENGLYF